MTYLLEPLVAGEFGPGTVMDSSTHPPIVTKLEYLLDEPYTADLITSFPVFLVSNVLSKALEASDLLGFRLRKATIKPSEEYRHVYGNAPHKQYRRLGLTDNPKPDCWLNDRFRLCVSNRMMKLLRQFDLTDCDIKPIPERRR